MNQLNKFETCLAVTLPHEGGFANHPRDPGGATMKGVTLATYRRFRPGATVDDLRNITDAELRAIYRDGYWNPVRGDDLPAGIDMVTFDYGVNSGPSQGAKGTQRALGVVADGKIGPATIAAARAADPVPVIRRAAANRMGMLRGLRTWDVFGRGWSRRVADVEAKAMAMALAAVGSPVRPALVEERDTAAASARKDQAAAVGTGGAGAGSMTLADIPTWGIVAIGVVVVVAVIMAMGAAKHQRARANAMQRAAEEAKR